MDCPYTRLFGHFLICHALTVLARGQVRRDLIRRSAVRLSAVWPVAEMAVRSFVHREQRYRSSRCRFWRSAWHRILTAEIDHVLPVGDASASRTGRARRVWAAEAASSIALIQPGALAAERLIRRIRDQFGPAFSAARVLPSPATSRIRPRRAGRVTSR